MSAARVFYQVFVTTLGVVLYNFFQKLQYKSGSNNKDGQGTIQESEIVQIDKWRAAKQFCFIESCVVLISTLVILDPTQNSQIHAPCKLPPSAPCEQAGAVTGAVTGFLEVKTPIFWYHCPKCGSSFIDVFYHSWCPTIPAEVVAGENLNDHRTEVGTMAGTFTDNFPPEQWCNYEFAVMPMGHTPLQEEWAPGAIGIFRHPRARLWSSFNFGHQAEHMNKLLRQKMMHAIAGAHNRGEKYSVYANWPGIGNCQTKMLLGHHCAADHEVTLDDYLRALELVKKFQFLGLTSEWDRSVCLFHKKFGPERILDVELLNVRPGHYSQLGQDEAYHNPDLVFETDFYDYCLYIEVEKIVYKEFKQYGC